MAGNPPPEGLGDDFFEQILAVQPGYCGGTGDTGGGEVVGSTMPMMGLQLGTPAAGGLRTNSMGMMPLGLNLEHHGFLRQQEDGGGALDKNNHTNNNASTTSGINVSLSLSSLFCFCCLLSAVCFLPLPII